MARGRGRPRKQPAQKQVSSSKSSKGSVSSSSSLSYSHNTGKQKPDPLRMQHEVLSPRSSLAQLQSQSLYANWAGAINGGHSASGWDSRAAGTVPVPPICRHIVRQQQAQWRTPPWLPMEVDLLLQLCKVPSHLLLCQRWVAKHAIPAPSVDEEGFQLVCGRDRGHTAPQSDRGEPSQAANVANAAVLLSTSNGFEILSSDIPTLDTANETVLGTSPHRPNE
ncbi:unnamed protein product [Amaranthus hypochondriacus]